jgi:hypothetical protein
MEIERKSDNSVLGLLCALRPLGFYGRFHPYPIHKKIAQFVKY